MSKLAVTLLLLGSIAVLWQQTEAKPFLLLPPNFFVLTTRAPTAGSRSTSSSSFSSSSTSSASGGLFQLPASIISRKLSFVTSLLSGFGGGAGASGSIGGGFGLGFKFNGGATTRRPTTTTSRTTEPSTSITPEVTTKAPVTTTRVTTTSTSASSTTAAAASTTSTEKSSLGTTVGATVGSTVGGTIGGTIGGTKGGTVGGTVGGTKGGTVGGTVGATVGTTIGTPIGTTGISVQPTVLAQVPATLTTTKIDFAVPTTGQAALETSTSEIFSTTGQSPSVISTTQDTESDVAISTGVPSSSFEVVTVGGKEDGPKAQTTTNAVISSVGIGLRSGFGGSVDFGLSDQTTQVSSGVSTGGYGYETPRPDAENEILSGNLSKMYLPVH